MDTTLLNSGVTAVGSRGPNRRGADTFIWDQGCKNPLNSGNEALMTFHPGQTESIVKKNRKTAKKSLLSVFSILLRVSERDVSSCPAPCGTSTEARAGSYTAPRGRCGTMLALDSPQRL